MNAYEKAKQLLQELTGSYSADGVGLPERQFVVMGEPVVDCDLVLVAVSSISAPGEFPQNCGVPQSGSFVIVIARDCANIYDSNGETIVDEAEDVARQQAEDAEFLWQFASDYQSYTEKSWDVGFAITGGLSIVSLTLTTGID